MDLFLIHFYWHYGALKMVISDCSSQFVSVFWNKFCSIIEVKLKLSTSHHLKIDGQTEIVNQHITMWLQLYMNYYQNDWVNYLSIIDYAVACLMHKLIGVSLFFVSMGYESQLLFDWKPISNKVSCTKQLNREDAQEWANCMEEIWDFVWENILNTQKCQWCLANWKCREINYNMSDYMWLSL